MESHNKNMYTLYILCLKIALNFTHNIQFVYNKRLSF